MNMLRICAPHRRLRLIYTQRARLNIQRYMRDIPLNTLRHLLNLLDRADDYAKGYVQTQPAEISAHGVYHADDGLPAQLLAEANAVMQDVTLMDDVFLTIDVLGDVRIALQDDDMIHQIFWEENMYRELAQASR